jgi:hypothetical protein
MLPKTALQKLAFKRIGYGAWGCELGARLDMSRVNAFLFPSFRGAGILTRHSAQPRHGLLVCGQP